METTHFKTFVAWSLAKGFLQQCAKVSQKDIFFHCQKKNRVLAAFFFLKKSWHRSTKKRSKTSFASKILGVSGQQRPKKKTRNDCCFCWGKNTGWYVFGGFPQLSTPGPPCHPNWSSAISMAPWSTSPTTSCNATARCRRTGVPSNPPRIPPRFRWPCGRCQSAPPERWPSLARGPWNW